MAGKLWGAAGSGGIMRLLFEAKRLWKPRDQAAGPGGAAAAAGGMDQAARGLPPPAEAAALPAASLAALLSPVWELSVLQ